MNVNDIEPTRIRNLQHYVEVTRFFLTETFASLNHLRNLLITLAAVGFAFLQTKIIDFHNFTLISDLLFWSVVLGIASFVCQWKYLLERSQMNERIAKEHLMVKPPPEKFAASIVNEEKIRSEYPQTSYVISVILLFLQIALVLCALFFMKSTSPSALSV